MRPMLSGTYRTTKPAPPAWLAALLAAAVVEARVAWGQSVLDERWDFQYPGPGCVIERTAWYAVYPVKTSDAIGPPEGSAMICVAVRPTLRCCDPEPQAFWGGWFSLRFAGLEGLGSPLQRSFVRRRLRRAALPDSLQVVPDRGSGWRLSPAGWGGFRFGAAKVPDIQVWEWLRGLRAPGRPESAPCERIVVWFYAGLQLLLEGELGQFATDPIPMNEWPGAALGPAVFRA